MRTSHGSTEVAVFCVGSPLQLVCAIEAKAWLGCRRNILVVREPKQFRQVHRRQMQELVQPADWSEHLSWEAGGGTDLLGLMKLSREARRLVRSARADTIFVLGGFGQLRSQVLRNHLKPKRTIIIDDGTSTLRHLELCFSRGKSLPDFMERIIAGRGPRSWFKQWAAGLDAKVLTSPVELFTGFDIRAEQAGSLKVHQHRFEELKRRRARIDLDPKSVWYFGSPLFERGILTLQSELSALRLIASHYARASLDFQYLAHRDDSAEKIDALRKQGVSVQTLDVPAEVHFATADKVAGHVASSVSTALYNVGCIVDGLESEAFPVSALVDESGRWAHERVTEQYRRLGIKINNLLAGSLVEPE